MREISTLYDLNELIKNNERVVVDFYADWCGPCKVLGKLLEQYNGNTIIAKADCEVASTLVSKFGVRSIPHMVKFKNGEQVDQLIGVPNDQKLEDFLND